MQPITIPVFFTKPFTQRHKKKKKTAAASVSRAPISSFRSILNNGLESDVSGLDARTHAQTQRRAHDRAHAEPPVLPFEYSPRKAHRYQIIGFQPFTMLLFLLIPFLSLAAAAPRGFIFPFFFPQPLCASDAAFFQYANCMRLVVNGT